MCLNWKRTETIRFFFNFNFFNESSQINLKVTNHFFDGEITFSLRRFSGNCKLFSVNSHFQFVF